MTLSVNKVYHTVGDVRNCTLNYGPWLLPGETINIDATVVSSSTTLLITNVAVFQGKKVTYTRSGGVAGEVATITATVNTSKAARVIETFEVLVNAP